MAFLYVNPDGVSRPYTTIASAMIAASPGDTLLLDPGTYTEQVNLDKNVNIHGLTDTPENNDVRIRPPNTFLYGIQIQSMAAYVPCSIIIENVSIQADYASGSNDINVSAQPSGADRLSLYLNRCQLEATTGSHQNVNLADTYFHDLVFDHLYFDRNPGVNTGYHHINIYWTRVSNNAYVLATEYNEAVRATSGAGAPFPYNYVITTTSGYGPAYGTDYISVPWGYVEGYVREQNSVVQRTLFLHDRDTGELRATTTSDVSGYYYMETPSSGSHYVVCKDDPADPVFNDLIIGDVYPTEL